MTVKIMTIVATAICVGHFSTARADFEVDSASVDGSSNMANYAQAGTCDFAGDHFVLVTPAGTGEMPVVDPTLASTSKCPRKTDLNATNEKFKDIKSGRWSPKTVLLGCTKYDDLGGRYVCNKTWNDHGSLGSCILQCILSKNKAG
jgi:hypothetical protein